MTQAPVAAQIHQALDVHRHVAAQIAFDQEVAVDDFANLDDFGFRQVADPAGGIDPKLGNDLLGSMRADSMDIAEPDCDSLLGRNIYAGDTCHWMISWLFKPLKTLN